MIALPNRDAVIDALSLGSSPGRQCRNAAPHHIEWHAAARTVSNLSGGKQIEVYPRLKPENVAAKPDDGDLTTSCPVQKRKHQRECASAGTIHHSPKIMIDLSPNALGVLGSLVAGSLTAIGSLPVLRRLSAVAA